MKPHRTYPVRRRLVPAFPSSFYKERARKCTSHNTKDREPNPLSDLLFYLLALFLLPVALVLFLRLFLNLAAFLSSPYYPDPPPVGEQPIEQQIFEI